MKIEANYTNGETDHVAYTENVNSIFTVASIENKERTDFALPHHIFYIFPVGSKMGNDRVFNKINSVTRPLHANQADLRGDPRSCRYFAPEERMSARDLFMPARLSGRKNLRSA